MNSNFIRRLKYYGIGFGLGLVFVFFFFKNRGCSWTPSNRVKNTILSRMVTINEVDAAFLRSKGVSTEMALSALNDGDIDFGASVKTGDTKVYAIDKTFEGKGQFRFFFTLPNESFISELKVAEVEASAVKNSTQGIGEILRIPEDPYLFYADDSLGTMACQLKNLGLHDGRAILKKFKQAGWIDFSQTNFGIKPKPEHYLEFVSNKDTIGFKAIWYKNKVTISTLKHAKTVDCDSLANQSSN